MGSLAHTRYSEDTAIAMAFAPSTLTQAKGWQLPRAVQSMPLMPARHGPCAPWETLQTVRAPDNTVVMARRFNQKNEKIKRNKRRAWELRQMKKAPVNKFQKQQEEEMKKD